ncbi:MAG: nuclear transport factor 2 family protein [Acidobacteria bacterium]|jgi:hypothetical protein|nr:nuclear transport factor 2 family protein [Acidobacteriota bacterium]
MNTTRLVMTILMVAAPLVAGQPEPTDHPDYETVKAVIEDTIGWAIDKDLDRLLQIFADEDLLLWWVDSSGGAESTDDLKETAERVWMTPDFEATHFEFRDIRIRFSKDGTIAWYSCHLDDCGIWKGEEFCTKDIRKTGVVEKRGDQWTIVQSHASWPVDKIPEDVWQRLVETRKQVGSEE